NELTHALEQIDEKVVENGKLRQIIVNLIGKVQSKSSPSELLEKYYDKYELEFEEYENSLLETNISISSDIEKIKPKSKEKKVPDNHTDKHADYLQFYI